MTKKRQTHLHPVENANVLDSRLRRFLQKPDKTVLKYIKPEMKVLELGCGPGYFTVEIAKKLNTSGKVIAADVQQGMLDILAKKIEKTDYKSRIKLYHCQEAFIGLNEKFDFILAFYSFHEMAYLDNIIKELRQICKSDTKILISEQKFHVSKSTFNSFIEKMENNKFKIIERPKIFLSRTVLMELESE